MSTSSVKTQEALLQRYRELYFDFKTEFRRSMVRSLVVWAVLAIESSVIDAMCRAPCRRRETRRSFSATGERATAAGGHTLDSSANMHNIRMNNVASQDAELDSLLNERRAVDSSRSMTSSIIEFVAALAILKWPHC